MRDCPRAAGMSSGIKKCLESNTGWLAPKEDLQLTCPAIIIQPFQSFRCGCVEFIAQYKLQYEKQKAEHVLHRLHSKKCTAALVFSRKKSVQPLLRSRLLAHQPWPKLEMFCDKFDNIFTAAALSWTIAAWSWISLEIQAQLLWSPTCLTRLDRLKRNNPLGGHWQEYKIETDAIKQERLITEKRSPFAYYNLTFSEKLSHWSQEKQIHSWWHTEKFAKNFLTVVLFFFTKFLCFTISVASDRRAFGFVQISVSVNTVVITQW